MESEILKYSATLHFNREVFLLNHLKEFNAIEDTDRRLHGIVKVIISKKSDQNESLISFFPFLNIIIRQSRNAFECISKCISYDAWVVFRPALESVLIIGKLLDNPENAELWKNRKQIFDDKKKDPEKFKKYEKEFEREGLVPKSLPLGKKFREVLKKINDEFMHMNYPYFLRHLSKERLDEKRILLIMNSTDNRPDEHLAYLYSFLHLYRLIVSSIGQALIPKYSKDENILDIEVQSIETIWGPKVKDLIHNKPELKIICESFGLWKM